MRHLLQHASMRDPWRYVSPLGLAFLLCCFISAAHAQISLSSAIDLALHTDTRVKLAEDDLRRATAVSQEMKDVYIPSASANGGAGYSYGITLTVPTIFTLDAQSLLYSPSQRHYSRASRWEMQAATLALRHARELVEEDVAVTYASLANMQQTEPALAEELEHATALASIVEQRHDAGMESELEWKQARRGAAQLRLQLLQQGDEADNLRQHLGQLSGIAAPTLRVLPDSLAEMNLAAGPPDGIAVRSSLGIAQAEAGARGREERALGDARSLWKPQVNFNAQYGRISPINGVSDYYNLQGRYNTAFLGVIIHVPFLDAAARARQREAHADADHASHELESLQLRESDDRRRLRHSLAELAAKVEVARLDASIAEDQLVIVRKQAEDGGDGGAVINPKDVERAAMDERGRFIDSLEANLQLRTAQITLLRQSGMLEAWIDAMRRVPARVKPGLSRVAP